MESEGEDRGWMKSEVEVGARAFASDRNHGACHWLISSRSLPNNEKHSTSILFVYISLFNLFLC